MSYKSLARWALVAWVCSSVTPAYAQVTDADTGNPAFLALFPSVRTAPRPAVFEPGLRVTYEALNRSGDDGPASDTLIEYQIVALDGDRAVYRREGFGDIGDGVRTLGAGSGQSYPGLGEFWINPSVLEGAEALSQGELTVTRTTRTLLDGATTVPVVSFVTQTNSGETVTEFSPDTGMLVFNSITTPTTNGLAITQVWYRGMRVLSFPWQAGRAPNWVRPGAEITFSGTETTLIQNAGGSMIGIQTDFMVTEAGATWSLFEAGFTSDTQPRQTVRTASGSGQMLDAVWLAASAADASLTATAERVDQDPITGAETWVSKAADGAITVERQLQTSITTWTYHPTLLVLDHQTIRSLSGNTTTTTEFTRTSTDAPLEALAQQSPIAEMEPPEPAGGGASAGGGGPTSNGGMAANEPDSTSSGGTVTSERENETGGESGNTGETRSDTAGNGPSGSSGRTQENGSTAPSSSSGSTEASRGGIKGSSGGCHVSNASSREHLPVSALTLLLASVVGRRGRRRVARR